LELLLEDLALHLILALVALLRVLDLEPRLQPAHLAPHPLPPALEEASFRGILRDVHKAHLFQLAHDF